MVIMGQQQRTGNEFRMFLSWEFVRDRSDFGVPKLSENREMADRFFLNEMPDFVPEKTNKTAVEDVGDSLLQLLSLPYQSLAESFARKALELKETIVKETWELRGRRVKDFSLYTGALGTAFLLLKSFQVTNNRNDLNLCSDIVKACDSASRGSGVTFICGRAGVCALGAVAAKQAADERLLDYYITQFKQIKLPKDVPDELLFGRAGFLWACSFLNAHIGEGTIPPSYTDVVVDEIIKNGRRLSKEGSSPLMYEIDGKMFWGAGHGLAGIMHVLMHSQLKPDDVEYVKGTLRYMIKKCYPSGNYPMIEGGVSDHLVHWCHGAPGVTLTLAKAAKEFRSEEFLRAAGDGGEVVWNRGLLKRVGICHGISGNAYTFLSLYRLTGMREYLYRAKAFACFLLDRADELRLEGEMHAGDHPYSLFEGVGGMAYLFLDMIKPYEARFPAYEI